ncbi:LOW QUALITY PROTEIN: hypothetical protein ACHAW6_014426, partial [Cyclotella cf. meneghiniana]
SVLTQLLEQDQLHNIKLKSQSMNSTLEFQAGQGKQLFEPSMTNGSPKFKALTLDSITPAELLTHLEDIGGEVNYVDVTNLQEELTTP